MGNYTKKLISIALAFLSFSAYGMHNSDRAKLKKLFDAADKATTDEQFFNIFPNIKLIDQDPRYECDNVIDMLAMSKLKELRERQKNQRGMSELDEKFDKIVQSTECFYEDAEQDLKYLEENPELKAYGLEMHKCGLENGVWWKLKPHEYEKFRLARYKEYLEQGVWARLGNWKRKGEA